jgi:ribonuclease Z
VLTHFSQRYPRVPVLSDATSEATGIAFDMMTVNLANLHTLPLVMPVLEKLFKEEEQIQSRVVADAEHQ